MRGRIIDNEFISNFVSICVSNGKITPDQICLEAKSKIDEIDNSIKEIQKLKSERTKYNDILISFQYKEKNSIIEFKNLSSLILDHSFSNELCNFISTEANIKTDDLIKKFGSNYKEKIFYTIKQLAEIGVLTKDEENVILRGPNWENYVGAI